MIYDLSLFEFLALYLFIGAIFGVTYSILWNAFKNTFWSGHSHVGYATLQGAFLWPILFPLAIVYWFTNE